LDYPGGLCPITAVKGSGRPQGFYAFTNRIIGKYVYFKVVRRF
jgi:hypothetical protein